MIERLVNCRLLPRFRGLGESSERMLHARPGFFTVFCENGRVGEIIEQPGRIELGEFGGGSVIEADGGLLLPALVDAHLHLDLAYSRSEVRANQSGTLGEAIEIWAAAKCTISAQNVFERAMRAIAAEVEAGVGSIRTHVDVGAAAELRLVDGVLEARQACRDRVKIQVVAFPQDGLVRDPHALENLRLALGRGCELIGGIPHVERSREEGVAHLEMLFDLAQEFDCDLDVHIDETDDPYSTYTEHLATLTLQRSWQTRVTASHVCALASYPDAHAERVLGLLAEAQISVVTNPGVNLHLQGRHDGYPKRRGVTRITDLLNRGVICAAGQDCIDDPFYPLGNGNLLDQAFLLAHAEHLDTPPKLRAALEMVSGMAAELIGSGPREVNTGEPADLVVFDAADVSDLLRRRPAPVCVLHAGRMVGERAAARSTRVSSFR